MVCKLYLNKFDFKRENAKDRDRKVRRWKTDAD